MESYAYQVPAANITVVASGDANPDRPAVRTVDGSGLVDGLHSNVNADMWLSNLGAAADTFIQYEFNRPQLLQKMMVWNIDLTSLNANLQSVTSLTLGVEGGNASGMLLFDDIGVRTALLWFTDVLKKLRLK